MSVNKKMCRKLRKSDAYSKLVCVKHSTCTLSSSALTAALRVSRYEISKRAVCTSVEISKKLRSTKTDHFCSTGKSGPLERMSLINFFLLFLAILQKKGSVAIKD